LTIPESFLACASISGFCFKLFGDRSGINRPTERYGVKTGRRHRPKTREPKRFLPSASWTSSSGSGCYGIRRN